MIRTFFRHVVYREKADSKSYIEYLCKAGCVIGDGTVIYTPRNTLVDITRPWLITIGRDVKITDGVKILTHGFDWSVLSAHSGKFSVQPGKS